jgi:outer membrane protein with beta-barrel domain
MGHQLTFAARGMRTRALLLDTLRAIGRTAVIVGVLSALLTAPSKAQVLIGMLLGGSLASENFNIGFEIGMNLSTVDGLDGASRSRGTLLGLFASWRFSEHYHLYTGIMPLSDKGAKDADPIPLNDPTLDPVISTGKMERDLGYFDIPIILQLAQRRSGGFRVGAGPQIGILLSAKDRYAGITPQGTPVTIENDIEKATQRFDAGVAFDAEYKFTGFPLAIGVRYYYGLTDVMKDSGASLHNQVLSGSGRISLGVSRQKKEPEPKK